jgi:hypothetical protein
MDILIKQGMIYPNPAKDKLYIVIGSCITPTIKVDILSITGNLLISKRIVSDINELDVKPLPLGTYVILIYKNNELLYKEKFVKE